MPYLMFFFFLIVAIMGASFWPVVGLLLFQVPFLILQTVAYAIGVPIARLSEAIFGRQTWIYSYFIDLNMFDILAYIIFFLSRANGDLTFGKIVICIACVIASFAWVRPLMTDNGVSLNGYDFPLPEWLERELDGPPKRD